MSGGNGSDARRIILPGSGLDEPDGQTIDQWIQRHPDRAVSRAELDAFTDILVKTKVRELMIYVLDKKDTQYHQHLEGALQGVVDYCNATVADAIVAERARAWWRRLGRWIATFGHKPVLMEQGSITREEADRLVDKERAPLQMGGHGHGADDRLPLEPPQQEGPSYRYEDPPVPTVVHDEPKVEPPEPPDLRIQ